MLLAMVMMTTPLVTMILLLRLTRSLLMVAVMGLQLPQLLPTGIWERLQHPTCQKQGRSRNGSAGRATTTR